MSEFFPRMDVGKMHFHDWKTNGADRIPKRNAGVSVGGSVEDDALEMPLGLLEPVHQLPLPIRLPELYLHLQHRGTFTNQPFDVRKRRVAVDFRLAGAEQVEIGTV